MTWGCILFTALAAEEIQAGLCKKHLHGFPKWMSVFQQCGHQQLKDQGDTGQDELQLLHKFKWALKAKM